ncbi:MAG: alpha/beta hydrolase [Myxococcota bacterium]
MSLPSSPDPSLIFTLKSGRRIAADGFGDPTAQPVLFLHGGGQTRHAWAGSAEALGRLGFYSVTLDHRGHGDSDWAGRGQYGIDRFAEDLVEVASTFDTKPIVVGASLGGLAAIAAEETNELPVAKAIVLVDISPRMELAGVQRIISFMRLGGNGFASLEEAADAIASYTPHRKRETNFAGLAKNLRFDGERYHWHWDPDMLEFWDPEGLGREDHDDDIIERRLEAAGRIEAPILLIRGRMSDVLSEEAASEFLRFVAHAEYVDLADAAHMVAGDRNDAFTDAVAKFILDSVSPGATP